MSEYVYQSTNNPSTPPKNGRCLLFALSRELRDMIYEYALTEQDGLFTQRNDDYEEYDTGIILGEAPKRRVKFWPSSDPNSRKEYNALPFVCRQLFQETKGLELRCNTLTFRTTHRYQREDLNNGLEYLKDFLSTCSLETKALLKNVTVISNDWPSASYQFLNLGGTSIVDFCANYPTATITIRLQKFTWNIMHPSMMIFTRNIAHTILRGGNPELSTSPWIKKSRRPHFVQTDVTGIPLPKNLRIMPSSKFKPLKADEPLPLYIHFHPSTDIEQFMNDAKEWCEKGF